MMNPLQIANELETFKRQHGGGNVIDEAVSTLRRQHEELTEAAEVKHRLTLLLRWVKSVCGRRLSKILMKRTSHSATVPHLWGSPKPNEIQKYEMLVRDCENVVSGL